MMPFSAYRRDQRGSSVAEFALVLPLFLALVLGVVNMSMVVYSAVDLHDATEWTARCLAVSANNPSTATTVCPPGSTATQIQAYGKGRYTGPNISPTFALVSGTTCTNGTQVQGSGNYSMNLGLVSVSIPITAQACFPYDPPS
jgi:Flp pilus assembly protein TadG